MFPTSAYFVVCCLLEESCWTLCGMFTQSKTIELGIGTCELFERWTTVRRVRNALVVNLQLSLSAIHCQ
eukprot:6029086-Amphidinium_carterae.1